MPSTLGVVRREIRGLGAWRPGHQSSLSLQPVVEAIVELIRRFDAAAWAIIRGCPW
jgi:hypothetical protein